MSNEYKKYAIEGMLGEDAENVEEQIDEWFFDGFDNPENLNYLPDDEVKGYEQVFDWNWSDYCKFQFEMMVQNNVKVEWIPLLMKVFPTTDKEAG